VGDSLAAGTGLTITKKVVTTTDPPTPWEVVTTFNNFYEFGIDKADPAKKSKAFKPRPWSVAVEGACGKPGVYTLEDILKPHPLEERIYRHRCVEAWSIVMPVDRVLARRSPEAVRAGGERRVRRAGHRSPSR
jgi:sulfoxide reductase catalytic subunit YedY